MTTSRNHTIARLAYALAQSDGTVTTPELQALEGFLLAHPERFTVEDRFDILGFIDDFQFAQRGRTPAFWTEWRLRQLPSLLLVDDAPVLLDLLMTLAEADRHVAPQELDLIARVREALNGPRTAAA